MEGPLLATRSTCQLVLEHLWGVLQLISESWGHSPSLPVLPCVIVELTRQIHSLQTQEASLQKETSQLDKEIQPLKLKLQNPLDEQDQYILQLDQKVFQAEAQCLEMKKKLASAHREMNFTCQIRNLYKKMAQDLGKELERTTSYYHRKLVLFHQDRVAKSWVVATSREREFQELRKENDHLRRMLAGVESSCRPVLRDPLGPAAPPTAHAGWEVSGGPWGDRAPKGDGRPTVRAPGPGVACKGDRAQGSRALSSQSPAQHLRGAP
ncbi:hypothetical protein GH733_006610 [Mirounga leonina]|nr:hypothetical protein GH733_006610 [Mirounga leonina]